MVRHDGITKLDVAAPALSRGGDRELEYESRPRLLESAGSGSLVDSAAAATERKSGRRGRSVSVSIKRTAWTPEGEPGQGRPDAYAAALGRYIG